LPPKDYILVVDSELGFRAVLTERLDQEGFLCLASSSVGEALKILETKTDAVKVVISEMHLPDTTGLELLREMNRRQWAQPVIILAADGSVEWAKQSIKTGAFEYYEKPVDLSAVAQAVRQALHTVSQYPGPERRAQRTVDTTISIAPGGRDELTGLVSHRCALEIFSRLRKECRNRGVSLGLCMLDVDGFRELNNRQGLSACDHVLVEAARRLRRLVRADDVVGRYGGDEFLIIFPEVDENSLPKVAERISRGLHSTPLQINASPMRLSLCLGLVTVGPDDSASDLEFIDRAVEAIYHAKLTGPQTVVTWTPQLIRETRLWELETSIAPPAADVESVNVMAWRFRELNRQLANVSLESLRVLVAAVEARDPYTKDHSVKVASFSRYMAEELELPDRQVQIVHSAGLLHDIGKIGIPDAILTKPGRLRPDEFDLIRQHPVIAVNILEQTRYFTAELPLIRHHHERYDGAGYPDGLAGQEIPLGSRIINIADATEAMFAPRSYKNAYSTDRVTGELQEGMGRQFDPTLAELAIKLIRRGVLEHIWNVRQVTQQATVPAEPEPAHN